MNTPLAAVIVSFIGPMLALIILFAALARRLRFDPRGAGWCVGLGLMALGALMIPVAGLPLARVLAAWMDHWSVPLLVLLVGGVSKTYFGAELLRRKDRQAMWVFGVVTGVVLYPLALGIGSIDPFSHGWHFGPLFVVIGIVAMYLQWRRNRFGIVLLLAFCAWLVGLSESGNFWDCLTDPVFFFISIGALVMSLVTKSKQP